MHIQVECVMIAWFVFAIHFQFKRYTHIHIRSGTSLNTSKRMQRNNHAQNPNACLTLRPLPPAALLLANQLGQANPDQLLKANDPSILQPLQNCCGVQPCPLTPRTMNTTRSTPSTVVPQYLQSQLCQRSTLGCSGLGADEPGSCT